MIGRIAEARSLLRAKDSPQSEFVAIYGRRRIGKTFLVRQVYGDSLLFSHTGVENVNLHGQLRAFASSLRDAGNSEVPRLTSWFDAFDALKGLVRKSSAGKKILFLDELPWMDTPKSEFIPALEFFWNGWCSARSDVLLVVCGSATSWILNKILRSRGGLHNRVTEQIWLRPFTLAECEAYAEELNLRMSRFELAEAYMVLGGVPYYWSFLKPGLSLSQNIDSLLFAPDAKLRLEFGQLYASLFKRPEPYLQVVSALSAKVSGLSRDEIAQACHLPDSGKLSTYLEELEQCGFVRRYQPLGVRRKGYLTQLVDNFTLFHDRYLRENVRHDPNFWTNSLNTPLHRTWAGLAFERLCLLHVDEIKRALGISGVQCNACCWRGEGAQIDLLLDRADRVVNICEMKFCEGYYMLDKEEDLRLRTRREIFLKATGCRKSAHLTLVTTNGPGSTKYQSVFQSVITLDDLFRT